MRQGGRFLASVVSLDVVEVEHRQGQEIHSEAYESCWKKIPLIWSDLPPPILQGQMKSAKQNSGIATDQTYLMFPLPGALHHAIYFAWDTQSFHLRTKCHKMNIPS